MATDKSPCSTHDDQIVLHDPLLTKHLLTLPFAPFRDHQVHQTYKGAYQERFDNPWHHRVSLSYPHEDFIMSMIGMIRDESVEISELPSADNIEAVRARYNAVRLDSRDDQVSLRRRP